MYLKTFCIENIKCFGEPVTLNFDADSGKRNEVRRWNVILGENGTGKSTLLQAIAISLMGDDVANRLRTPKDWVREGEGLGNITAEMIACSGDQLTGYGAPLKTPYRASLAITSYKEVEVNGIIFNSPTVVFTGDKKKLNSLKRGPWSPGPGWLSTGYGPFRRLSGGSPDALRSIFQGKKDARFLTLFREDAALEDLQDWLKDLDHRSKEEGPRGEKAKRLQIILKKIVDHLLPEGISLSSISSEGVFFSTPYGKNILMTELSDGYRSMLALSGDLLHRIDASFENIDDWVNENGEVIATGIVLIDELDAHLHPIWQRQIGFWLQEKFPNIQFIVTTHSPFIAQAADTKGVFVLREQDDNNATKQVRVSQDEKSVRGWRADQILAVLFNVADLRSPEARAIISEHSSLQAIPIEALSSQQKKRLAELDEWLNTHLSPPGETEEEMARYRKLQDEFNQTLAKDENRHD